MEASRNPECVEVDLTDRSARHRFAHRPKTFDSLASVYNGSMPPLRDEEEWARQLMEAELRVPVEQHDDGSRPGMHDLDVIYEDGLRAAVEVTSAVDAHATEFWNTTVAGSFVERNLVGGWFVLAKTSARRLREKLPPLLRELEDSGIREFRVRPGQATATLVPAPPGVVRATQGPTAVPGSIYVQPDLPNEQVAAFTASTGDALAKWLADFLRDPARADVRTKLMRSGAAERHSFVVVSGLSGAPFTVAGLLIANDAIEPVAAPDLPPEITHVWAVSPWASGVGFRWSPATGRWQRFSKPPPHLASGRP